jgi:hypothetical protein
MLDFIPNHTARDHPWVQSHPEYYVPGTLEDLAREPGNYGVVEGSERVLAFGRDPYFPGWSDTFQLNYGKPEFQEAMTGELMNVSAKCDGVRCDMAMLVLPQIFHRTWGIDMQLFWPPAIQSVRAKHPGFTFMAEVYWDLEWELQQQGFDYAYDKRLYDRLRAYEPRAVREHFYAGMDYQGKLARFLENHDEPRAAATFPPGILQAAGVITFLSPGLKFFYQGQLEGVKARLPVHICRAREETPDHDLVLYYSRLLEILKRPVFREGEWHYLEPLPAWTSNWTNDCFISFTWSGKDGKRYVIAVNYCSNQSQCNLRLPFPELVGRTVHLVDLLGDAEYIRPGSDILENGLYVDLPPWGFHVFELVIKEIETFT